MTTEEHEINLRDINSDDENAELLEGDIENQLHETHRTHLLTERPLVFSKRRFGYFTILYTIMMIVFLIVLYFGGKSDEFTVATYNIQHGAGLDKIINIKRTARVIRETQPLLIALSEVDYYTHRNPVDQVSLLANLTSMNGVFGEALEGFGGKYGNAILSRETILATRHIIFKAKTGEKEEPRSAIGVLIEINNKKVWFIATHLDFIINDQQYQQALELLQFVKNIQKEYPDAAFIIAGDFNSTPESKIISKMKETFTDIWDRCGQSRDGFTFPSGQPFKRIDYIFISKGVAVSRCKTICDIASDHCQLAAKIRLL